jgi:pyruvate dehydrogenase E2 component (dihydrolipoamide acetyltransferase)
MAESKTFCVQRRVVAHKTVESWQDTPHVSVLYDLDASALTATVRACADDPKYDGVRITLNAVLLKAVAAALARSPEMNGHIWYDRRASVGRVTPVDAVHIAIPLRMTDGRMVTPVLRNVDGLSLRGVALGIEDIRRRLAGTNLDCLLLEAGLEDTWQRLRRGQFLTVLRRLYSNFIGPDRLASPTLAERRAHKRIPATERLVPADLLDATTLVSNVGSSLPNLRLRLGMLMIISPNTTAIGLGPSRPTPVAVTGPDGEARVEIRPMLPVTVCFDHRAMDFEHITGFFRELDRIAANPEALN